MKKKTEPLNLRLAMLAASVLGSRTLVANVEELTPRGVWERNLGRSAIPVTKDAGIEGLELADGQRLVIEMVPMSVEERAEAQEAEDAAQADAAAAAAKEAAKADEDASIKRAEAMRDAAHDAVTKT